MTQPHNILIHEFDDETRFTHLDADGEQMIGFYFQFTDEDDLPLCNPIGPYRYNKDAEKAALRAFKARDF